MIEIVNLYKAFNGRQVLKGITLNVQDGEFLALIGRSGIGKSVLLKHVVGLMEPDEGHIMINGTDIHRLRGRSLVELRKQFGFLFQGGALFDSMTVYENVAFPLREKTIFKEAEIKERVFHELEHMGLKNDGEKYPAELSGGMRKRVALARALVMEPSIMLFDEPTTGLDPIIGQTILDYIQQCHQRYKFSGIMVTHEVPKVFSIVQQIAMIHEGEIIVCGTPEQVQKQHNPIFEQFVKGDVNGPVQYI
ncbi:MAG: ATP-binding cassette domain-containing protein [Proteobacteria bacterium]|nr:ATP-binding cassette domain-containing protein [Pseudomonadota bacterium]